jgi:hypothetical protein
MQKTKQKHLQKRVFGFGTFLRQKSVPGLLAIIANQHYLPNKLNGYQKK